MGGILSVISRVTDKLPGDIGHPVQWDSTQNNWYIIGAGDCFYAALLATGDPDYANRQASKFVASEIHEQNN